MEKLFVVQLNAPIGSSYHTQNLDEEFIVSSSDFFVMKGKLYIPVKGANKEFPESKVDFCQDELFFVRSDA